MNEEKLQATGDSVHPKLEPNESPSDCPASPKSADYQNVPLKKIGTIPAAFIFAGQHKPPLYPEE